MYLLAGPAEARFIRRGALALGLCFRRRCDCRRGQGRSLSSARRAGRLDLPARLPPGLLDLRHVCARQGRTRACGGSRSSGASIPATRLDRGTVDLVQCGRGLLPTANVLRQRSVMDTDAHATAASFGGCVDGCGKRTWPSSSAFRGALCGGLTERDAGRRARSACRWISVPLCLSVSLVRASIVHRDRAGQ